MRRSVAREGSARRRSWKPRLAPRVPLGADQSTGDPVEPPSDSRKATSAAASEAGNPALIDLLTGCVGSSRRRRRAGPASQRLLMHAGGHEAGRHAVHLDLRLSAATFSVSRTTAAFEAA